MKGLFRNENHLVWGNSLIESSWNCMKLYHKIVDDFALLVNSLIVSNNCSNNRFSCLRIQLSKTVSSFNHWISGVSSPSIEETSRVDSLLSVYLVYSYIGYHSIYCIMELISLNLLQKWKMDTVFSSINIDPV